MIAVEKVNNKKSNIFLSTMSLCSLRGTQIENFEDFSKDYVITWRGWSRFQHDDGLHHHHHVEVFPYAFCSLSDDFVKKTWRKKNPLWWAYEHFLSFKILWQIFHAENKIALEVIMNGLICIWQRNKLEISLNTDVFLSK